MSVSESQKKYAKKYQSNFDDIKVRVPKGKRAEYKQFAESKASSLNQFILDAIEEKILRES